MEKLEDNLGAILKEERRKKGYTLQQVADKVGVSTSYIHRIENNQRKNVSYKTYNKLKELYSISSPTCDPYHAYTFIITQLRSLQELMTVQHEQFNELSIQLARVEARLNGSIND